MKMEKKTTKKAVPKEGIFLFKNSKGFGFRIKQNKFVLVTAQGYNTKAAVGKGLLATYNMLRAWATSPASEDEIIDLTKKK